MTAKSVVWIAPGEGAASLSNLLTYRNDIVVRRFRKRFDISQHDAEVVFVELLRWLWYLGTTSPTLDNPEAHAIDEPLSIIDEMWHEFILVTQDYTDFCNNMCRRYIHHAPNAGDDPHVEHEGLGEVKASLAALLGRKRAKYTAIYECLGKDVFVLWYLDFPQRFSTEVIALMRKKIGFVDLAPPYVADNIPQDAEQEKRELIEEALLMNLLRSLPDTADSLNGKKDGDREVGRQGLPQEEIDHFAQGARIASPIRCESA